jgi:hypothetical protein
MGTTPILFDRDDTLVGVVPCQALPAQRRGSLWLYRRRVLAAGHTGHRGHLADHSQRPE